MGEVCDFRFYQSRKLVKERARNKKLIYEVYLSTIQFVHLTADGTYEDPGDYLNTSTDLRELYMNDEEKFWQMFDLVKKYWRLEIKYGNEIFGRAFDAFPTVESLCFFIKKEMKIM
ncbi:hypothetical protein [Halobacillus salinus]|uniref:Uncharacterized protein n=1 Tax=Halobacillus salinus TaxID=192814 RepID=A0A4Z0H3Y8_9BACI|nr:hypothetical protein [Halobacillus salinus]TGB05132.1 hypothetical protein E4663_09105 [Halobacillus salinus]